MLCDSNLCQGIAGEDGVGLGEGLFHILTTCSNNALGEATFKFSGGDAKDTGTLLNHILGRDFRPLALGCELNVALKEYKHVQHVVVEVYRVKDKCDHFPHFCLNISRKPNLVHCTKHVVVVAFIVD